MKLVRHSSSRIYLDRFVERAAKSLPSGGRVLDAGAGDAIYARHFGHAVYESADFGKVDKRYAPVTYECDLAKLPVEDRRFDLVLLTQVLEHLPDPSAVLGEIHRVLRPGGSLWLTAPLYYPEHEAPYDFFRYTQYGLAELVRRAGFEITNLEWLEGYLGTLSQQLRVAGQAFPIKPAALGTGASSWALAGCGMVGRIGCALAAEAFSRADAKIKLTNVGHPKNYAVVARRPADA